MPATPRRTEGPSPAELQRTLKELDAVLSQLADLLQTRRSAKAEAPVLARGPI